MPKLHAYIDEAANLADENQFFIIGVVSTYSEKKLRRIIKSARNVLGKSKRQTPRIKFCRVSKRIATYVLKKLNRKDFSIYVWVIDKGSRRVKDTPENYGVVLSYVLRYGFDLAGWDRVWIDEKYIKERDKTKLWKTLEENLKGDLINKGKIAFTKSEKEAGLGLADFVAGAFYTAYNRGNHEFIDLIKSRVVFEEKILWREMKQKQKTAAPKGSVGPD